MGEKKLLLCPKIPISICNLFICPQCVCNTFISLLMFIYLVIRKNSEKTFIKNTATSNQQRMEWRFSALKGYLSGYSDTGGQIKILFSLHPIVSFKRDTLDS